jgi:hypothetical protein
MKLIITESQLKKIINEQNDMHDGHVVVAKDKKHEHLLIVKNFIRWGKPSYGIYDTKNNQWLKTKHCIYSDEFLEHDTNLIDDGENGNEDYKVVTEYVNNGGDRFYLLHTLNLPEEGIDKVRILFRPINPNEFTDV